MQVTRDWVDEFLLHGRADDVCLSIGGPITRQTLRGLVADRQLALTASGAGPGTAVALQLPPSVAFIANLLAGWRAGAQMCLLDHRLTAYETEKILERIAVVAHVTPKRPVAGGLRAYHDVEETIAALPNRPAGSAHSLLQLSSGSTGPSKVIGRTAESLIAEVDRYGLMEGVPRSGERVVLLASMVHVLGLVGGLLYGLHSGVELAVPERVTGDAVLDAVGAGNAPTTLLGVPFHIELMASVTDPPRLPQLTGMTTGGELVRPTVYQSFVDKYGVRLGNMYGMTEVGVIATDLFAQLRPSLDPAPGITVAERDGELLVGMASSPYVGLTDPSRWVDGWLHTKDAGRVDPDTGHLTVLGRLDSQVSVGGLKVDLTEVEQALVGMPEVVEAVVVFDRAIEAYVVLDSEGDPADLNEVIASRLAAYKRPRAVHVRDRLPRTATGKLVRDVRALRATGIE